MPGIQSDAAYEDHDLAHEGEDVEKANRKCTHCGAKPDFTACGVDYYDCGSLQEGTRILQLSMECRLRAVERDTEVAPEGAIRATQEYWKKVAKEQCESLANARRKRDDVTMQRDDVRNCLDKVKRETDEQHKNDTRYITEQSAAMRRLEDALNIATKRVQRHDAELGGLRATLARERGARKEANRLLAEANRLSVCPQKPYAGLTIAIQERDERGKQVEGLQRCLDAANSERRKSNRLCAQRGAEMRNVEAVLTLTIQERDEARAALKRITDEVNNITKQMTQYDDKKESGDV